MSILIFSHTDYYYLWPIIEEYMAKIDLDKIFLSNKSELKVEKPRGFNKYLEYDGNKVYAQRWLDKLPEIDSKYIIVVHDVNIIINCDANKIKELISLMDENRIDRLSLNAFNGSSIIDGSIKICNLNRHIYSLTYVPYDLCAAIWNKSSFFRLWENFPFERYRDSECNSGLQDFCRNNYNVYGLQKTDEKVYFCLNRPYFNFFKILHITIQGELTGPFDKAYMDGYEEFKKIFDKYKLDEKVSINNNYGGFKYPPEF